MRQIAPCLWFNDQALQAAKFYTSVFRKSRIGTISRYGESGSKAARRPKGSIMTVTFWLNGQEFMGLNGGPVFKFSPAVSLIVYCRDQKEVDRMWAKLSAGGRKGVCGWLTDKFGVSWQIVPRAMDRMMSTGNAAAQERVMKAVLGMRKLDIKTLERAYVGKG